MAVDGTAFWRAASGKGRGIAVAAALGMCGTGAALAAEAPRGTPKGPPKPAVLDLLRQRDEQLDSLRSEQQRAMDSEQKLAAENNQLTEERRALSRQLVEAATRLRSNEDGVAAAEAHLRQLDSDETEIRRSFESRRASIAEVLAALQRMSHRPPPALLAGADDAVDSVRMAMSVGALLPEMRTEATNLLAQLSGLAHLKAEQLAQRDLLAAQLSELAESQKSIAGLIEQRQKRLADIGEALGGERQRVLGLSRQADTLKELIGKLEQGLDGVTRAARANARAGDDAKNTGESRPGLLVARDPGRLTPAISFVSARGKLKLPVSGTRIHEFGGPDGAGGNEKGISLATRAGTQVTAPCDGWVVYAAPYRSYGQLLILDVGGGYHVLLAGMDRFTVDLGQFVLTGEPVAVMGSGTLVASVSAVGTTSATGPSSPVLYIEFRKEGTPVDPNPWWAATENEKARG